MYRASGLGGYLISIAAILTLTALVVACSDSEDDAGNQTEVDPQGTAATDSSSGTPQTDDPSGDELTPTPATTEEDPTPTAPPTPTPEPTGQALLESLDLELELLTEGLVQPTDMVPATDGTDRLFVTSRGGTIHVIEDGEVRPEPLIDINERVEYGMVEQGLLSIALHPRFAETGYFYVNYTSSEDQRTIVSRFEMADDGEFALPDSEFVILEVEQPHYSHNGGNVKFGPDGYLYIALGDGENPGDPHGNAQNPGTLLGSILRIDVEAAEPYAIPVYNPFVGDEDARYEVWAYGLRNPWRFSFHPETGDMYIVDVGQSANEEVNVQPADSPGGENYGWPIMEGDECYEADECEQEGLTMPVATYQNPDEGCAVIGGYAYYGTEFPEMEGVYFFGDWCSGNIRGMVKEDGEWVQEILVESDLMINAFGLDQDGEIYVLDYREGGGIYQIVASEPT